MEIQARVHAELQAERVGEECEVLIDGSEGDWAIGRAASDAPEVDAIVRVADPQHSYSTGSMLRVRITAADGYDLEAVPVSAAAAK